MKSAEEMRAALEKVGGNRSATTYGVGDPSAPRGSGLQRGPVEQRVGGTDQFQPVEGQSLPASSPGGSAITDERTPVSPGQPESQGGAGNPQDPDFLRDRGKPMEYHENNVLTIGSKMTSELINDTIKTLYGGDKFKGMNSEDRRRAGNQANKAFFLESREQQDEAIEKMIYGPQANAVKKEIENGTIDSETGGVRLAEDMLQVQGAKSEAEVKAVVKDAGERLGKGDDDNWLKRVGRRVKEFWKRGKDDPDTPEDESQETYYVDKDGNEVEAGTAGAIEKKRDVQVTKFMGGMTRQQLGMFMFQWGGLMMANADKGFGGAMGMAGLGAMEGHMGREAQGALEEESQHKRALESREQERKESETASGTINTEQGVLKWNPETKKYEPMMYKDPETGEETPYMPSALASRPPVDKWKIEQWQRSFPGMSEQDATLAAMSGITPQVARDRAEQDFSSQFKDGFVMVPGKGRTAARSVTDEDKKAFINDRVKGYGYDQGEGGALGPHTKGPPASSAPPEERLKAKPSNWSSEQWDEYNQIMDESEKLAAEGA